MHSTQKYTAPYQSKLKLKSITGLDTVPQIAHLPGEAKGRSSTLIRPSTGEFIVTITS